MSDHDWALQHLPWYVNGTLVGDEYAKVHLHLSECLVCQQEQAMLARISEAVAAPIDQNLNAAAALSELNQHLSNQAPATQSIWQRLENLHARTPTSVTTAFFVQTAALALMLYFVAMPISSNSDNTYRTLSSTTNSSATENGNIRVLFSTGVQLEQQQQLLHQIKAQIVDGPTLRGVYTLKVKNADQAQAARTLQQSNIVDFAQPIDAGLKDVPAKETQVNH